MSEALLPDRSPRSQPFGGGCALAFGVACASLALIALLALATATALPAGVPKPPTQSLILIVPTLLFAIIVGAGLVWSGRRDRERDARTRQQAALHPDEPWYADYAWDPAGADAEATWGGPAGIFVLLFVLLVAAPFNVLWLAVLDPKQEPATRAFALMVLVPDFFMFVVLRAVVKSVRSSLRFGRARFHFDTFPFFLGRAVRGRISAKAFEGQESVSATLRCLDDRMVTSGVGGHKRYTIRVHRLHEARQALESPFRGEDVPVTFKLPEGLPPTNLRRTPPLYWELEVRGDDGFVRFVVPVYAPAGS
jgi:hypothetical protein